MKPEDELRDHQSCSSWGEDNRLHLLTVYTTLGNTDTRQCAVIKLYNHKVLHALPRLNELQTRVQYAYKTRNKPGKGKTAPEFQRKLI